jgi:hypothetical protein
MRDRRDALLGKSKELLDETLARTHHVIVVPNTGAIRTHEIGMPAGEGVRQFEPQGGESVREFAIRVARNVLGMTDER